MAALRKIIESIRIWLDKQRSGNQFTESSWGKFRVHYRDGGKSIPMSWHNARTYRDLFGGDVAHIRTGQIMITDNLRGLPIPKNHPPMPQVNSPRPE